MKFTPVVNLTNIFLSPTFYQQLLRLFLFTKNVQIQTVSETLSFLKAVRKMLMKLTPGADAINISGLLVQESGFLNPSVRSDKWFPNFTPNFYLGVQTPKQGIPKLGVNFLYSIGPSNQFLQHFFSLCFITIVTSTFEI